MRIIMTDITKKFINMGRRAFLKNGVLTLAAASLNTSLAADSLTSKSEQSAVLRIGMFTDLHYADKAPAGSRHYRETPTKLAEAAEKFSKETPDFIVELGDLIDAADSVKTELDYLQRINKDFAAISKNRHYVLGNHCVDMLTKQEFLDGIEREKSYYSFDAGDFHFVLLDACFRSDGVDYGRKNFKWTDANIPAAELEWLKADLKATTKKTIVYAHQRLDGTNRHCVKNAAEVRKVLEDSKKVLAVFQGHSHKNDYQDINGIHYCTLVAMVEGSGAENNGYSMMKVYPDGTINISGFRNQSNYTWE